MKQLILLLITLIFSIQLPAQNVGIGESLPNTKLEIKGDSGNDLFNVKDQTNDSKLYILNNGNVGIGTTAPSQKLEVTGGNFPSVLFSNNASGRDLYIGGGSQANLSTTEATVGVTNGNLHIDSETSSKIYFQHYANTDAIFNVNGGNVGIGTASPGFKLDVSGTARFTGQVIVPTTPTANAHAASKEYVDNQVGAVTETDPTWSGAANTTASVTRTGNISVGDLTVTGDDVNSNTNLRLNAGNGYVDFRPSHTEHGLIIREYDGSGTSWGGIRVVDSDRMELRMDGGSYGGSLVIKDNNNVGIGTTSPSEKLDVSGNIKASGEVYWGNNQTRTQTRNDAGAMGSGVRSGFYETSSPANFPAGASSWWHLLDIRHNNVTNNYGMQIAGSFFDQNLWYRKTDNSATTSWSRVMSSNDINGTTNYVSKFTGTNSLGNSQIYDNGSGVGIGTTSIPSDVVLEVDGAIGVSRMGIGGTYNSSEVQGIWSIAPNYKISTADNDFGTQYGIAYAHTNAGTTTNKKPIAGWGHQIMLTSNGTRNIAMSMTNGNAYFAGNIGIGTTSPSDKLDVHGDIGLYGKLAFRGNDTWLRLNQDGNFSSGVYTPGNLRADGGMYIQNTSPTIYFTDTDNPAYMIHVNSDRMYVLHGSNGSTSWNGNRPLTIYQGNKVGINNSTPSYELHVSGRIKSNGINETSDIRFKKEINTLEKSLEKIEQLRGVSYYWRQDEFPNEKFNDGLDLGLIAQEVEEVIPQVVHTDNEGYKSVQYSHIVPVLVEAIKEQQKIIMDQKALICEHSDKIESQAGDIEYLKVKLSEMDVLKAELEYLKEHMIHTAKK